ncbi:tetratricopeptide repeat-containing sensor histidine kinase [Fulvivirga lutea]|uniref:histidine kinase n=1 Tax=Fulvivirga lutea TaxID=2810512 RepID=A0A974WGV3_9BACT|nr:tetratricopeptide repeat-containing sensor histidine kinase [Fulvivirga lutea]QSE96967.1 tetratricopeptide repeat-containing sensor histidine kinase [Fulvivirga lutea]
MARSLQVFDIISKRLFLVLLLFVPTCLFSNNKADSLLNKLNTVPVNEQPSILMDLFVSKLDNLDSALLIANRASDLAKKLGDSLNYVRAEYAIAYVNKNAGNFQEALIHYQAALKSARINGIRDREKASLNGLALTYYSISKFDLALRYHFESLKLREEEGDKEAIAIACNNIGLVYYQLNDYNKALIYFERSKQIEEEEEFSSVYGTYTNMGLTYIGLGRYQDALSYFNRTIENCSEQCSELILVEAYLGKGICLQYFKDIEKAKTSYLTALQIARKNDFRIKRASIYNNLATIYIDMEEFSKATDYLDSSHNIAVEARTPRMVQNNYREYAKISFAQKKYKEAYQYQVLYDSVSNEILNEVIAKNLLQIQVDFEERENLEIIELQNKEINRRTTLLFLAVVISVLTALVVILLYRNNNVRKRVNRRLRKANDTIEEQNRKLVDLNSELEERVKERTEELRASNAALIKSNHELDNFIYKTSHDIRGPLATLQGICNIALMDIKDTMSVDYFQKLSKTASKLNRILSKLLIVNQINNSLPTKEDFDFSQLVIDIVDENKIGYIKKEINVLIKGEEHLHVTSDPELLKIIVSNIINNAFKFHDPSEKVSSFIEISFIKNDNQLVFEVVDNGLGINDSISDQIFDIFSKTSEIQDSAGMGLYLVKLAVDKLEGEIEVTKTEQSHTKFRMTISLI